MSTREPVRPKRGQRVAMALLHLDMTRERFDTHQELVRWVIRQLEDRLTASLENEEAAASALILASRRGPSAVNACERMLEQARDRSRLISGWIEMHVALAVMPVPPPEDQDEG